MGGTISLNILRNSSHNYNYIRDCIVMLLYRLIIIEKKYMGDCNGYHDFYITFIHLARSVKILYKSAE